MPTDPDKSVRVSSHILPPDTRRNFVESEYIKNAGLSRPTSMIAVALLNLIYPVGVFKETPSYQVIILSIVMRNIT